MKRRLVLLLAIIIFIIVISPKKALASNTISEPSADIAIAQVTPAIVLKRDDRAAILQSYLEQYNSPLAAHSQTIIKEADQNHIDWKLIAAISGVESNFGILIPPYSYNGWGYGVYGDNVRRFTSWDDGISVVSTALRQVYINGRDEQTIYAIGATYAADPLWAYKVMNYVNDMDLYAERFDKPTLSISF